MPTRPCAVGAVDDAASADEFGKIVTVLVDIFKPHTSDIKDASFDSMIMSRATRLHEKKITAKRLLETIEKAKWLDRAALTLLAAMDSTWFGAAGAVTSFVPETTNYAKPPFAQGAVAGTIAGLADTIGTGLLARSKEDALWLASEEKDLEPAMAAAKRETVPTRSRDALERSVAIQSFTARNLLRTGIVPVITYLTSAETGQTCDSLLSAIGSPVAGAAGRLVSHSFDASRHRVGPEYLFARKDWEARFDALEAASTTSVLAGAARRAGRIPVDAATDLLSAVRSVFTATSVVKNGAALTAGMGLAAMAKSSAETTKLDAQLCGAVGQAANTAVSAPVYAAWAVAGVYTGAAVNKIGNAMRAAVGLKDAGPAADIGDLEAQLPLPATQERARVGRQVSFLDFSGTRDTVTKK
ncbi:hypothetical protein GWC77_24835 [Paraburkholderia sp. NMBU_R16]|uniref:hypothetical protein n=1 Tax=Paraburkholderia sp. NMBU_R16 TaxID=2698676 RepID=UPI0015648B3C|nr:hypothetical protein [Paraburkholderia sp. NMBU_R16]NRO99129.1 hypothetical protein [Paraburkholderia sp. NMBU_R16]